MKHDSRPDSCFFDATPIQSNSPRRPQRVNLSLSFEFKRFQPAKRRLGVIPHLSGDQEGIQRMK